MTPNEHAEQSERADLIRKLEGTAAQQERCHYPIFGSVGLMRQAAALLAADKAGGEAVAEILTTVTPYKGKPHHQTITVLCEGNIPLGTKLYTHPHSTSTAVIGWTDEEIKAMRKRGWEPAQCKICGEYAGSRPAQPEVKRGK